MEIGRISLTSIYNIDNADIKDCNSLKNESTKKKINARGQQDNKTDAYEYTFFNINGSNIRQISNCIEQRLKTEKEEKTHLTLQSVILYVYEEKAALTAQYTLNFEKGKADIASLNTTLQNEMADQIKDDSCLIKLGHHLEHILTENVFKPIKYASTDYISYSQDKSDFYERFHGGNKNMQDKQGIYIVMDIKEKALSESLGIDNLSKDDRNKISSTLKKIIHFIDIKNTEMDYWNEGENRLLTSSKGVAILTSRQMQDDEEFHIKMVLKFIAMLFEIEELQTIMEPILKHYEKEDTSRNAMADVKKALDFTSKYNNDIDKTPDFYEGTDNIIYKWKTRSGYFNTIKTLNSKCFALQELKAQNKEKRRDKALNLIAFGAAGSAVWDTLCLITTDDINNVLKWTTIGIVIAVVVGIFIFNADRPKK